MKAEYKISEQDYVNAVCLNVRFTLRDYIVYSVIALFYLGLVYFDPQIFWGWLTWMLGGAFVFLFSLRFIIVPFVARKHYRKYNTLFEPVSVKVDDEGVTFSTEQSHVVIEWEKVHKWREDDDYVLIYLMPRFFHIVPKSIDKDGFDLQKLLGLLQRKVGKPS